MTGIGWPRGNFQEMVDALSAAAGIEAREPASASRMTVREAIEWAGLETEAASIAGADLERGLRAAAPALIETAGSEWLALVAARSRRALLVGPDRETRQVAIDSLCHMLRTPAELPHIAEVDEVLNAAGIEGGRRAGARAALLRERLSSRVVVRAWTLRTPPGASFAKQARTAGVMSGLASFLAASLGGYILLLAAWWLIGRAALEGRVDWGWVAAWVLALIAMAPLRLGAVWSQGMLALALSGLLKQRLLAGALRVEPDELRELGSGQLLGRVLEGEQVESLALNGALDAVMAAVQLVLAGTVLALGAGGWLQAAALAGWTALVLALAWLYGLRRRRWTERRVHMTNELVESMAGHRTRLAQQEPAGWHTEEDASLEGYLDASRKMDSAMALLAAFSPRGWLLIGAATLMPAFTGSRGQTFSMVVGLGGVLLAYRAFRHLASSLTGIAGSAIAWTQVAELFRGAARPREQGTVPVAAEQAGNTVLVAEDVSFRYSQRAEPVLQKCSLRISEGDWLLLEGRSGGGKSTLASLLTGLRTPAGGVLLAGGYDRQTLGESGWRRRIASAPQYHENHVLAGTFLFNLLMGRHWPPSVADMEEAAQICEELGLGPLVERMPAGLMQIVGETGWQLSQGERSRLFLARALLQAGRLIVLDESFAALDPETLALAYQCVRKRAKTLLLIGHP